MNANVNTNYANDNMALVLNFFDNLGDLGCARFYNEEILDPFEDWSWCRIWTNTNDNIFNALKTCGDFDMARDIMALSDPDYGKRFFIIEPTGLTFFDTFEELLQDETDRTEGIIDAAEGILKTRGYSNLINEYKAA